MCSSRKYPYSAHGRSLKIPGGWGVFKAKILEAKYEAKLEFPGGWGRGIQNKNPSMGGVLGIFWNCTILIFNIIIIY